MKKLIILFLFTIPFMVIAQNKKIEPIDVTKKMSVDNFLKIRNFVFDQKKTELHGGLYGKCPFSQINNDISVFLLPIQPLFTSEKDIPIETYNKIELRYYFEDKNNDYMSYIDLLLKDNQIYLIPYWDTKATMKTKVSLLKKILPQILKIIE